MTCPQCQRENPADARFCTGCGRSLELICEGCRTPNPRDSRFCKACGKPLAPPSTAVPALHAATPQAYTPKHLAEKILTSRSALEGERKQVTVLLADLKGSLELLADRDPEQARKILDPVLERMMEAVHHYEGTVNQVMGDGIMALFGAPVAHEDHAVRACYAALRMQEAVGRYAEELRRSHGLDVQIRVGLNSGEVVVRSIGSDLRMDYSAVGQTTHLAARMEQLARPGASLMTEETIRLAEGYVEVKPLGPVPVKGLAEPVRVYEIVRAGPARSRLQAAAVRGLTRFVGRGAELEALRQALEKARAGHGQVLALVGEPGVGKSRLFYEFTHSHRTEGWLILESGSVSYGKATPYLPVIDLLNTYFQIETRDDDRKIREKLTGKLLTLDRALEPALPAFLALMDVEAEDAQWLALDPPQRRKRTLEAVKRLLLRESQVQPLCLVFEDLHWVDTETQAFLDSLVESLPTARILLLVNYRPEYQHGWGSRTYYSQLRIDPLPPESAEELLEALLGKETGLQPLKQLLIARAEGNPFFLEESVRTLVETQVLVGERGAYRLAKALSSIQVSATVQAVLASRIDRLAPEDKTLLQSAAVIGKDVPFTLLQAIADLTEDELRRALGHLQASEFLYETSLFPDLEYTFKHALTHEVAYGSLLGERRRALHARILEAMEALYADRLAEQVDRLAYHALRGERWEKAVAYFRHAGAKWVQRSANREAAGSYEQALEALNRLPESRSTLEQAIEIRLDLGPALMAIKGRSAAEVELIYARARELCQQMGETPQLFPVLWGLWFIHLGRSELEQARELGEQLLTVARRAEDPGLLLEAHHTLWPTLFDLGELLASRAHWERGIALYDPEQHGGYAYRYGNHDPGVCCRSFGVRTLWLLGYPDQALKMSQEALTLARQLSHPYTLVLAHYIAARLHHLRGERHPAEERIEAALTLATEQGFPVLIAQATVVRGRLLADRGQVNDGIARMRQGLAAYRATGAELRRRQYLALLAEAYAKGGQAEDGLSVVSEALATAERTGERSYEAELYRLKGELLLRQSVAAEQEAEGCFRQAIAVARRQEAKAWELRAVTSLSRLRRRQGKKDEARRMLSEIYGWFTEGFDTRDLREAKALLEELA